MTLLTSAYPLCLRYNMSTLPSSHFQPCHAPDNVTLEQLQQSGRAKKTNLGKICNRGLQAPYNLPKY